MKCDTGDGCLERLGSESVHEVDAMNLVFIVNLLRPGLCTEKKIISQRKKEHVIWIKGWYNDKVESGREIKKHHRRRKVTNGQKMVK